MNAKDFNRKLSAFIRATSTQRDNLQLLLEAGFEQVQESGNTIYLSKALAACVGVRSLPTNGIKEYIKAHVTNIKWSKDKAGNMVFSKVTKGEEFIVTVPECKWYEFKAVSAAQARADVDALAQLKGAYTRTLKALRAGTIKADQREKVEALLPEMAKLLA